jgi:site-specific DNA-cytosine methylase
LAGRLDDREGLVGTLREHVRPGSNTDHTIFVKHRRAGEDDPSPESWGEGDVSASLDGIGHTARTATPIIGQPVVTDSLLPLGLDSHRYRTCGNGVVAPVAEWIGRRLAAYFAEAAP